MYIKDEEKGLQVEKKTKNQVKIKICGLRTPADVAAVNAALPEYAGFIFVPMRRRYVAPAQAAILRQQLDPRIRPVGVFVDARVEEILEALEHCPLDMVQLHGAEDNDYIAMLRAAYRDRFVVESSEATVDIAPAGEPGPGEPGLGPINLSLEKFNRNLMGPGPMSAGERWRRMADGSLVDVEKQGCISGEIHGTRKRARDLCIVKAFRVEGEEDIRRAEASAADEILLDHGAGGTGERFDWTLLRDCHRRFFLAGGLTPDNVEDAIRVAQPYAVDASSSLETDGRKDPEKIRRFVAAVRGATR